MSEQDYSIFREKKLIRLSLIILFLSLLMVYLLLYQIKGKNIKQSLASETNSGVIITVNSWEETTIIQPETISGYDKAFQSTTNTITWKAATWTFIQTATSLSWIHMLSWTKLFYGKIESIDKLSIKYQYALIDGSWTFLINLGVQTYDFDSITRALGWNIYKITTEQELAKNKLFGDKVLYINLPIYKDKLVLMLEYIGQEVWLIQIEYKLYHTSKWYLKSLFIN